MKKDYFSRYRLLITLLLCISFFIAGYYISPFARFATRVPETEAKDGGGVVGGDEEYPVASEVPLTGAATRVFAIRNYLRSNSVQIVELPIQPSQMGLDELSFSVTVGDWKILKFGSDRIYISKDIAGYGPGCFTLSTTKYDGREKLALYTYDDDGYRYLKEAYEIFIENFPEEEQVKLRSGITVIGEENLYRLLENYAE